MEMATWAATYSCENYASINAAVAAIGATPAILLTGTTAAKRTLTGNLTIPATLALRPSPGCPIIAAGAYTLTIDGPFEVGPYQVFSGFTAVGLSLAPRIYPQWFGALGDGVADDTAAIQAAADAAAAAGSLLFAPVGNYKVTSTVTLKCSGDLSLAHFKADGSLFSPAIRVGPTSGDPLVGSTYLFDADLKLPKVTNTGKPATGWAGCSTAIGVEIANVYQSRITVPYVYSFGVGLSVGGYNVGCGYNTITIGILNNNKINLELLPKGFGGWCNQNTFIGGKYSHSSAEGSITHLRQDGVAVAADATFTSATGDWVNGDAGDIILIEGAGVNGAPLVTTIASRNSATSIELTDAPSTSVNPATYCYGQTTSGMRQIYISPDLGETGIDGVAGAGDATFTSASVTFTDAMIGFGIHIEGAGAGGIRLSTTIASRNSAHSIELADAASTAVNPASFWFGNGAPNNNVFVNPSIEGDGPEYHVDLRGSYNVFIAPRGEVSGGQKMRVRLYSVTTGEVTSNSFHAGYDATGIEWIRAGKGTSVGTTRWGSSTNNFLEFSGDGIAVKSTTGSGYTAPQLQGFESSDDLFSKTASSTDWIWRLYGGGLATKSAAQTYPMVDVGGGYGLLFLGPGNAPADTYLSGAIGSIICSAILGATTFLQSGVSAGVTASSPGVQGDSPITKQITEVSVCGTTNDAVTAPAAVAGREFTVINHGAQTLEIWPASGDNLGAGVNTAVTLAAGGIATYVAYDTTNWVKRV
jgi:hypothetical protein